MTDMMPRRHEQSMPVTVPGGSKGRYTAPAVIWGKNIWICAGVDSSRVVESVRGLWLVPILSDTAVPDLITRSPNAQEPTSNLPLQTQAIGVDGRGLIVEVQSG